MNKNRFFNGFVAAALALMLALTLQGAIQTARVARAAGHSDNAASAPVCDKPAVERASIRQVYAEQMDTWLTYTDDGPTGVDGGLIHLLSNSRSCSE